MDRLTYYQSLYNHIVKKTVAQAYNVVLNATFLIVFAGISPKAANLPEVKHDGPAP